MTRHAHASSHREGRGVVEDRVGVPTRYREDIAQSHGFGGGREAKDQRSLLLAVEVRGGRSPRQEGQGAHELQGRSNASGAEHGQPTSGTWSPTATLSKTGHGRVLVMAARRTTRGLPVGGPQVS